MVEPALGPFHHGHAVRVAEVFLQPRADDLRGCVEAVEVKVKERQASAGVFVHEREARRGDARGDAEAGGEALDQLGLARAEVAAQREDPAAPARAAPLDAEGGSFFGAARNDGDGRVQLLESGFIGSRKNT